MIFNMLGMIIFILAIFSSYVDDFLEPHVKKKFDIVLNICFGLLFLVLIIALVIDNASK